MGLPKVVGAVMSNSSNQVTGGQQTETPTGHIAVILLDEGARIVDLNNRARQMFASEEALLNRNGCVLAANGYAEPLSELIWRVIREPEPTREVLVMRMPQLPLPIALAIQTYRVGHAAVAVIASDPNLAVVPDEGLLRALYGLTAAEIRVACALTTCQSITEIARAQDIAPNTARTHLKRLFQKTGSHRQSELVIMLLTVPVVLTDHLCLPVITWSHNQVGTTNTRGNDAAA
jgi:DNA-binding CsgD family transcriptional regulator